MYGDIKNKMKIALSFPTTFQLVEKVGALFEELYLIGFNGDYSSEKRYKREFPELGIKTHFRTEHYSEIDPHEYDLLIDSLETRRFNPEWREYSMDWDIPRILKILWDANPGRIKFTDKEMEVFNKSVVSTENYTLAKTWSDAGMEHVEVLLYYPGWWWFDKEWTGEIDKALYILTGIGKWRDVKSTGYYIWKDIEKELPNNTFHQDGSAKFLDSKGLSKMCKKHRCYVNLDNSPKARPLCLVFTEAISAGIPPIVLDSPYTDYHKFIEDGVSGFICKDTSDVVDKIKILLRDHSLAKSMSDNISMTAKDHFSKKIIKSKWESVIKKAKKLI